MKSIQHPFMLVCGLAMQASEFTPFGRSLLPNINDKFYCFDNINVGNGPRPPLSEKLPLTILSQAKHQWAQLDKNQLFPVCPINLFGMSMGGMIAATMASLRPDRVNHLFLAVTSANLPRLEAIPDKAYGNFTRHLGEEEFHEAISMAFGQKCLTEHPEIRDKYFNYRKEGLNNQTAREFISQVDSIRSFPGEKVYQAVANLNCPVTIISGSEDQLFNHYHHEILESLLPHAKALLLKDRGHMIHLENLPSLTDTVLGALA